MSNDNGKFNSPDEARTMAIRLLERIDSKVDVIAQELKDTREKLIHLQASDLPERAKSMETRLGKVENRVTRVETRSAVIVAGLSILISGLVSFVVGGLKGFFS